VAELSHRKRVPGARLVWLFRVTPVRRTLVSAGRQVPGRSVRWGNLRRLRPFSDRYGCDRGTPIERYYIERFLWGPSVDELSLEELDVADPHVPLVACAHAENAR
jgi:hypothetical protein